MLVGQLVYDQNAMELQRCPNLQTASQLYLVRGLASVGSVRAHLAFSRISIEDLPTSNTSNSSKMGQSHEHQMINAEVQEANSNLGPFRPAVRNQVS